MRKSTLKIRAMEYDLAEVLLRISVSHEDDNNSLTFDLFADSQELAKAGIAINSLSIRGSEASNIENATFELDENDDGINELRESVICEPGTVLELSHLKITFGPFRDGLVDVRLDARCMRYDDEISEIAEENIPVVGTFVAKIQT